jgi:hypothetical protein
VFFKQSLQTITGAKLQNTLKDELALIEKNTSSFFFHNISYHESEEWRELAVNAYRAANEAKEALETAKRLQPEHDVWLQAYHMASKADKAVTLLLQYKLQQFFSFQISIPQMLVSALGIPMLLRLIRNHYQLTKDQGEDLLALVLILVFFPKLILAQIFLNYNCDLNVLGATFIDPYWCTAILNEAQKVGIDINIHQRPKPQSQPWSNAELLEDMQCFDIPDGHCCDIGMGAMSKPVHSRHHTARYDEINIHTWFKKQNTHPVTGQALFWDDLIPDTELEAKINAFTHDKTKEYIQATTMRPMLERIEMYAEDNQPNQQRAGL